MPSITDKFGKASISTDVAIATTVKTTRLPGVLVLEAIDLSKYATDTPVFVVTYKKTTDPVTGVVSVSQLRSWKALVNTGANTLTNLTIQPGYADDIGNAVGDFIECIPTTAWENSLIDGLFVGHNPDGTFKKAQLYSDLGGDAVSPEIRAADGQVFDYVVPGGGVLVGLGYGANLNVSLSGGFCYINGKRQIITAVPTRGYTANKDTYVDALYAAGGTVTIVYTEVANNAASPALAANSIRLGIVVSGATIVNVGSINQGQEGKVLPIASSIAYMVTDSLGNLICPRDPNRKVIGYREVYASQNSSGAGATQILGLTVPVNFLAAYLGRKVRLNLMIPQTNHTTGAICTVQATIWEGTAGSGTQRGRQQESHDSANVLYNHYNPGGLYTPAAAGLVTYNGAIQTDAGTETAVASATSPMWLEAVLD